MSRIALARSWLYAAVWRAATFHVVAGVKGRDAKTHSGPSQLNIKPGPGEAEHAQRRDVKLTVKMAVVG